MSRVAIIRVVSGRVTERHERIAPEHVAELIARAPGEYRVDEDNTPLTPLPAPVLPPPVLNNFPGIEELTDAILRFADGDRSGLNAIRARLQQPPKK